MCWVLYIRNSDLWGKQKEQFSFAGTRTGIKKEVARFFKSRIELEIRYTEEHLLMKRTIFERYGGFASVSRVVMEFYDRVLDSPEVSPYFANSDMKRLIDHQTKFMATLMGGPASYTNEQLERVHARLGITESAFYEVIELLSETLEDFDFRDEDVEEVEKEMICRKNFIVAKK